MICRAHARLKKDYNLPDELTVSLSASSLGDDYIINLPYVVDYSQDPVRFFRELYPGYADTLLDKYEAQEAFSLDQHIGYPDPAAWEVGKDFVRGATRCEKADQVPIAMVIRRDGNQDLNYFKLLCVAAPQG